MLWWLFLSFGQLSAQTMPACTGSLHAPAYTNPLYERWLSLYDIRHYELELDVHNTHTRISGVVTVLAEALQPLDTMVLELQDALEVSRVLFSEQLTGRSMPGAVVLDFEHVEGVLYVFADKTLRPGDQFRVQVHYGGDAGQDRGFFAGINSARDHTYGFDVTYTLSEPHNASDWFPAKQVLEDKIDSVTFHLRCDKDLLAGSNGVLTRITDLGRRHELTWKTGYPMAYYLLSFAVADYRDFSFRAGLGYAQDSVLVQNYIYDDDRVLSDWETLIRSTAGMITSFSTLLTVYPFAAEKYGHAMAPMGGGMEHQTMTTIHDFSFYLVAHELAHQWFGDHITCGNWQDIWINEGFASYFEYIAAQEILGLEAADQWMGNAMSVALNERQGSVFVPEDRVDDTYRLFDHGLSYKKGAILLHMIRFILDDDNLFFSVLRNYLEAFGNGLATGEDFKHILEQVSGEDFSCFFGQWYYGEGYPGFRINWSQRGDTLRIRSEQTATAPEVTPLFQLPFELEIRVRNQPPQRIRLFQSESEEKFTVQVDGLVEEVIFDPAGHLLATSDVIQEWPAGTSFRYGPNPVTGTLFIQAPNSAQIESLRITSITGEEVLLQSDLENPVTMDLSGLADGPYILELSSNLGTYQEQIVKVTSH